MLIVNQNRDTFVNSDDMSYVYISFDDGQIKYISKTGRMIKLAKYSVGDVTKAVFEKLYRSIGSTAVFEMPDENTARAINVQKTIYEREKCKTGKKTVRRGGS